MKLLIKTLLVCLLIGVSFGGYLYVTYDPHWQRILTSLISTVAIGLLMMTAIYQRNYLLWISSQQSVKLLVMITVLCLAALVGTEFTLLFRSLMITKSQFIIFSGNNVYVLNILIVLVTGLPIYVNEEAKQQLNKRLLSQQYHLLQLEKQHIQAELELLRAKVNPHFLYNVHNTIAGLIRTDQGKAEEMILLLSRFFRSTLNKNSTGQHSITDELDIVQTYLKLQQIRYGSRLKYQLEIDPGVNYLQVPSFILQPLVENAIKHGIEPWASQGLITVKMVVKEQKLILSVGDSGPAFPDSPGSGHGLSIIISKLKLLYADRYSLELINIPYKNVRITIPLES